MTPEVAAICRQELVRLARIADHRLDRHRIAIQTALHQGVHQ